MRQRARRKRGQCGPNATRHEPRSRRDDQRCSSPPSFLWPIIVLRSNCYGYSRLHQLKCHNSSRYCYNCASIQIGKQALPAQAMLPCDSRDIKTPLECSSFSSDSIFIDLPAAWPYLALPVSLVNRPPMSDMVILHSCSERQTCNASPRSA
jgi:hypothetical protein